jgi:thiol-disulfide isomerase/thioredoxin
VSGSTATFVAAKSTPQPRCQIKKGKGGTLFVNQFNQAPASLVLRSAVIQSYRVEDEFHPKIQESDAFALLPARISPIKRIEIPSQFQSLVLGESNALVVVRFYADACPSCKATSPLFRRWSRNNEALNAADSMAVSSDQLAIKIVEMQLNKKTSSFMQEKLGVDQLPYCHLYHPQLGLVEEQLIMNKLDFREFVSVVEKWARGLAPSQVDNCVICSKEELMEDCEEFC